MNMKPKIGPNQKYCPDCQSPIEWAKLHCSECAPKHPAPKVAKRHFDSRCMEVPHDTTSLPRGWSFVEADQ